MERFIPDKIALSGIKSNFSYRIYRLCKRDQKKSAQKLKERLDREFFDGKIVTDIVPFKKFHPAEEHHQDYYNKTGKRPYCHFLRNDYKLK